MKNPLRSLIMAIIAIALSTSCTEDAQMPNESVEPVVGYHIPLQQSQRHLMSILKGMKKDVSTRGEVGDSFKGITSVSILGKDRKPLSRASENEATYYVFRFGENEGFAIMSADRRLPDLLAIGEGNPNPNDPNADLPDEDIWTPPLVSDTATDDLPPLIDPYEGRPHKTSIPGGIVRVKWGNTYPYNMASKAYYERFEKLPDSVEFRLSSEQMVLAQIFMASKYRHQLQLDWQEGAEDYQVDFEKLYRCPSTGSFIANPEMAEQVSMWCYWLIQGNLRLRAAYTRILRDEATGKSYVEVFMDRFSGLSDANDHMPIMFSRLGLAYTTRKVYSPSSYKSKDEADIINHINSGNVVLIHSYSKWDDYGPHDWMFINNTMYFEDSPSIKYFYVNQGKGGNSNGYYLASGFDSKVYYLKISKR